MNDIQMLSCNCRGLGDNQKRKDIFNFLRQKKYSIYCLQDTHFTDEIISQVRSQWGYDCYFSNFKSNARGVSILINNNFECKVLQEAKDTEGNMIVLKLQLANRTITLANIYGPNTDKPNFFVKLMESIDSFKNDDIIICGDFNLVINPDMDCDNYLQINNPIARNKLLEIIHERKLIDTFRELNPNINRYTWRRKNPIKQARLDLFLTSESLLNNLEKANIEQSYRSDHSMISITLSFSHFKKGKGMWKFNTSLLNDIEYSKAIEKLITEIKLRYALPVYNAENINNIPNSEIEFIINDQLFLEVLLMEIRGETISYATHRNKERQQNYNTLLEEIDALEGRGEFNELLENKKKQLEAIREYKLKGAALRSRTKWVLEGEKPTKYFCNLENRNFTCKLIEKIETNNTTLTKQDEILTEIKSFYENLYMENQNIEDINLNNLFQSINTPKLNQKEAQSLEGPITYFEAYNTLKKMQNNKSPGSDGFPPEFF